MKIYIIGHISPDLDAITAAYTYAEFLQKSNRYNKAEIIPLIPEELNTETKYIFEKNNIEVPTNIKTVELHAEDLFILVDHNEESQRSPLINNDQIIEIVDHHKLNLNLNKPVRIDVKPLGSTNTIIYEAFETNNLQLSEQSKNLILSAILSDTQGLKSSTTTGTDSTVAHKLAKELNKDIEKLTFEIFKAKSDITGLSNLDICTKDFKVFDFNGTKVFINQIETVEPRVITNKKHEFIQCLQELKVQHNVSQAYLVITDILNVNSQVIYETENEGKILEKAFTSVAKENLIDIGPKMSRKKDIAPAIESAQ